MQTLVKKEFFLAILWGNIFHFPFIAQNLHFFAFDPPSIQQVIAKFEEGGKEGHQEIFAAIQKTYPDIDIEVIRAAIKEKNGELPP